VTLVSIQVIQPLLVKTVQSMHTHLLELPVVLPAPQTKNQIQTNPRARIVQNAQVLMRLQLPVPTALPASMRMLQAMDVKHAVLVTKPMKGKIQVLSIALNVAMDTILRIRQVVV
jgi:hypothetical protein